MRRVVLALVVSIDLPCAGATASGPATFAGLVHRWPADGNPDDVIGGSHALVHGPVTWVPGRFGQAFGVPAGAWLGLGPDPGSVGTGDFTIALWCRVERLVAMPLLCKRDGCATAPFIQVLLRQDGDLLCELAGPDGDDASTFITRKANLADGRWHHVAWRRSAGAHTVWVDGALLVTPVQAAVADIAPGSDLSAGWSPCVGRDGGPQPFAGELDEIQLYSVALSDCQVALLAGAACSADLDGDGVVGATDLGHLLAQWGACGDERPCTADLDGDGVTSAADLGLLLSAWSG